MRRPSSSIAVLALACALVPCATARADVFGPVEMASNGFLEGHEGAQQQALYAHDPVISGNGRYIVFDGYFGGRVGVWRRELRPGQATGPVEAVAVGAQNANGTCVAQQPCDAELPSISESGQYVSFTTAAPLAPEDDTNDAPDVYVRDMDISDPRSSPCEAATQPCAYTLVSAVDGKAEGLTYGGSSGFGAVAAGRSAISANGQEVAFVTTAISNLAACQVGATPESQCEADSPEAPAVGTPALQVAVRDLPTRQTQLVSVEDEPATGQPIPDKPVSVAEGGRTYGALYSPSSEPPEFPFTNNRAYKLPEHSLGASISADGSTVAWLGTAVDKQARMLAHEAVTANYTEPLWRRIANGVTAPTRRVTGGSEPESPACIASGESELPPFTGVSASNPCQGPFAVEPGYGVWAGSSGYVVPQLSADGYTVAFLATAQLASLGVDFGRSSESGLDDLYVANMHEGLTRGEALRPLTELVTGPAGEDPIIDLAISPDASQVAFATQRIEFPLGSPAYVSQPAAIVGMSELFDVDIADDTLTRVTRGYEGGASEHPYIKETTAEAAYLPQDGALSPSFSDDGDTLAFSSTASNLVYGDGNTPPVARNGEARGSADGSDAFFVTRKVFPPEVPETYVSSPPAAPSIAPQWSLGASAISLKNGSVRLYVELPGAGRLSVAAAGAVLVTTVSHTARAATRHGHASVRRVHVTRRVLERDVAKASLASGASGGGLVELTLTLASPYRALASRAGGFSASANIVFSAPGQPALKQSIAISFVKARAPLKKAHPAKRRAKSRR